MRLWLLFVLLVKPSHLHSTQKSTQNRACGLNGDHTYATPSGNVIEYSPCLPIYTSSYKYLIIDDHRYYWDESTYQTNISRPLVCNMDFDKGLEIFESIFFLEDRGDEPLFEKLNRYSRPTKVIYDCEEHQYCCSGQCCNYHWFLWIGSGILGVLVLCSCGYCCYRGAMENEREQAALRALRTQPVQLRSLPGGGLAVTYRPPGQPTRDNQPAQQARQPRTAAYQPVAGTSRTTEHQNAQPGPSTSSGLTHAPSVNSLKASNFQKFKGLLSSARSSQVKEPVYVSRLNNVD